MKKFVTIAAVGILGLVCMGAAAAGGAKVANDRRGGPGGPGGPDGLFHNLIMGQMGRLMVLRSEIDLTHEQHDKIHDALDTHRVQGAQAVAKLVEKGQVLRNSIVADKADEKAIRAAADDLGKAVGDLAVLASQVKAEVYPILTDEQRKLVDQFRVDSEAATNRWAKQLVEKAQKPPAPPRDQP